MDNIAILFLVQVKFETIDWALWATWWSIEFKSVTHLGIIIIQTFTEQPSYKLSKTLRLRGINALIVIIRKSSYTACSSSWLVFLTKLLLLIIISICLITTINTCRRSMLYLLWVGWTILDTLICTNSITVFINLVHKKNNQQLIPHHDWYYFPNCCAPN